MDRVAARLKVSMISALSVGLISAIGLFLFRWELYSLFYSEELSLELVNEYFSIRVLALPLTLLYGTGLALLRGFHFVKLSFYLVGLTTILNIVLSWAFIYPLDLGVSGAAFGTLIANSCGLILCFAKLFNPARAWWGKFWSSKIYNSEWFSFGANSANLFGRSLFLVSCFFFSSKIAANMGVVELATHQVALQFWLFLSYVADGVAITGHVYGAKFFTARDYSSLFKLFKKVLTLSAAIGAAFVIVFTFIPELLWSLFTDDRQVFLALRELWPYVAYSQIPMALAYAYDGLLFGTEDFAYIRKNMSIGVVFIFGPIAYLAFSQSALAFLWLGLVGLGLYRLSSSAFKHRAYIGKYGQEK
jgi:putative MATE family efflux protein